MPDRRAADPVLIRSHHAGAELVEDAEGGLVTRQAKLALELHRRHAGRLTCDEVGGPEPDAERGMTALHDGPDHQPRVLETFSATQDAGAVVETEWFSAGLTVRANETAVPTGLLQIGCARRVVGKKPLELGKRLREGQIGVVENVHARVLLSA